MKRTFAASIGDGVDRTHEAIRFLSQQPGFAASPAKLEVDGVLISDVRDWQQRICAARSNAIVNWPRPDLAAPLRMINFSPNVGSAPLTFRWPDAVETLAELISLIDAQPFDVCAIGWVEDMAFRADIDRLRFVTESFGSGHTNLGLACAFRERGHDDLVSRRWIEAGPWRVIRRPGDLTIVQFYDFDAEPRTAVRQATPGWKRLADVGGGFLPNPFQFMRKVDGLYDASRHTLERVVPPGEEIPPWLMNEYCAVRTRHHIRPPARADRPIDQVAFVFVDEAQARVHLDEMWLRELEVWVADGGGKRRLDDSYQPPLRSAPDWIAGLAGAT
jgi:hypothetical protein